MTTYTVKYRLSAQPAPREDGSGLVDLIILGIVSRDGGAYAEVPGYSQTISLPYNELAVVMDMPHANGAQRQAKNAALISQIADHAGGIYSTPPLNWSSAGITAWCAATDGAATEAARLHSYITVTLNHTYPVDFEL
jgi:hypothetical protein